MSTFAALYRQPVRQVAVVRVVAFYTNDAYAREIEALHRSLQTFALHYETRFVAGIVGWVDAVLYKPSFILQCLSEMQADAVFYTDADSEFRKKPDFSLFKDVDVSWGKFKRSPAHPLEHLTGSMFFRNTPEVRSFVTDWVEESSEPQYRNHFTPEMDSLRVTWEIKTKQNEDLWCRRLRSMELPPEMVWFDDCRDVYGDRDPIIFHRQASRKHRHAERTEAQTKVSTPPMSASAERTGDERRAAGEPGAAPP